MTRDFAFIIDRKTQRNGSAHLRGRQLSQLFAEVAADYDRTVRFGFADEPVRDAIAIVNKTALMQSDRDLGQRLKQAGCVVLMDFIDGPLVPAITAQADAFIACSALQSRHLRAAFPGQPVVHIPHHVDLDIPATPSQWDRFACGYFGNVDNAAHLAALQEAGALTVWEAKTTNKNGWYQALPDFNLHYAFRPRRMWGAGFKPFTKGFVAAHVGAVILVAESDEEATELLGADYPLRLPDATDAKAMQARLGDLAARFGDADWQLARQRMQRLKVISSADYIRHLIRAQFFEDSALSDLLR
ncbi:class I SAM-dependent methyltransferase [Falsiroseomonas tokyonensis]|uniref:Glycosyltransferase family 1 protein n=1 Tax=Falsiroseomonas tokyonensis TaxID=430521 RepID=A0ABV7BVN7_9PROT|nr:hypothetical protein [Falsiroseomonas tokyonensis]MBU8538094.1 hypothetical protein [Falsiroseomonas tokyonensis]